VLTRHFSAFIRTSILISAAFLISSTVYSQTKLLRFPDIHGDRVVFTYGGDLWTAPASGGSAIRLTAHPGMEVFGKFSPDGKSIAFTGQHDGDEQVYVIPATGGVPRQLTFYPAKGPLAPRWGLDNQVYGWSRDGRRIFFRSLRDSWSLPIARIFVAMRCPRMARSCSLDKAQPITSTTLTHRVIRLESRSPQQGCLSIEFPRKSGTRSSMKYGGS
jgi:dipeptidyl aminopeptidase/acylaminoacyl peptidase